MTANFGIDTSILVRLLTGDPDAAYRVCVERLAAMIDNEGAEMFASNQVIGEAYIAVQHHYGVSKLEARDALHRLMGSGLVAPLNGPGVFALLKRERGPGLLDSLIADDYQRAGLITLTLDRKMAGLTNARRL